MRSCAQVAASCAVFVGEDVVVARDPSRSDGADDDDDDDAKRAKTRALLPPWWWWSWLHTDGRFVQSARRVWRCLHGSRRRADMLLRQRPRRRMQSRHGGDFVMPSVPIWRPSRTLRLAAVDAYTVRRGLCVPVGIVAATARCSLLL